MQHIIGKIALLRHNYVLKLLRKFEITIYIMLNLVYDILIYRDNTVYDTLIYSDNIVYDILIYLIIFLIS